MPLDRISGRSNAISRSSEPPGARFQLRGHTQVDVKESSDVVSAGPNGGFFVVGDLSNRAEYISPSGKSSRFELEGVRHGRSGLEGVAVDPQQNRLFVASESDRTIYRYQLQFDGAGKPKAVLEGKTTLSLGGDKNKGIEGLAFLPGELSPLGRPQLVVAKEGNPRGLYLLNARGEGEPVPVEIDRSLKDVAKDFSAVAVDPRTGHLFITSDESSLIAEVALERRGGKTYARLIQSTPLRDGKDKPLERVEGATFDAAGNLFILAENSRKLHRFERA